MLALSVKSGYLSVGFSTFVVECKHQQNETYTDNLHMFCIVRFRYNVLFNLLENRYRSQEDQTG